MITKTYSMKDVQRVELDEECCGHCMHFDVDKTAEQIYHCGDKFVKEYEGCCLVTDTTTSETHVCDFFEGEE